MRRIAAILSLLGLALGLPYNRRIQYSELHYSPPDADSWTPYGGSQQFHEHSYGRTGYSQQYANNYWNQGPRDSIPGNIQFIEQHPYTDLETTDNNRKSLVLIMKPTQHYSEIANLQNPYNTDRLYGQQSYPELVQPQSYNRRSTVYQEYSPQYSPLNKYQRPDQTFNIEQTVFREPPYPTSQYPYPPFPVPSYPINFQNEDLGQGQQQIEVEFGQQEPIAMDQIGTQHSSEIDLGQTLAGETDFGQQQIEDVEFGQQQTDDANMGQQQIDVEFGQQQTDDADMGQQQIGVEFGQQQTDDVEFGQQQTDDADMSQNPIDETELEQGKTEFGQQQVDDVNFGPIIAYAKESTTDGQLGQQQIEVEIQETSMGDLGQQPTDEEFGQQQIELGQQVFEEEMLGQQQTDNVEFGQQQIDLGQQVLEEEMLGQQQTDNVEFGQQQIEVELGQQTALGQHKTDDAEYGKWVEIGMGDQRIYGLGQQEISLGFNPSELNVNKYDENVKENELNTPESEEDKKKSYYGKKYHDKWDLKKTSSQDHKRDTPFTTISRKTSYTYQSENMKPVVEEEIKPVKFGELGLEEGKAGRYKLIAAFLDELEKDIKQNKPDKPKGTTYSPYRLKRQSTFEENFSSEEKDTGFWSNVGKKIKTSYEKAKEKTKEIYEDVKDKIKGDNEDD